MTKKNQPRKRHNDEFKAEALLLAEKIGVTKAATSLDCMVRRSISGDLQLRKRAIPVMRVILRPKMPNSNGRKPIWKRKSNS
ncbi:Uncharacterised protein [BD1-7 clade bacterium]|uniref:Transposase n=1 Tax=BD1-7 clade bacterium TaxID=2029982 RepID=A0A5S9P3V0_9GAMM|nr:Uncharacterised protein [BD1-7 clade bacterium]